MNDKLLDKVTHLHEDGEHEKILELLENEPSEYERDGLYARALNNLERFNEAKELLLKHAKNGENDCVWHYRIGYSYYWLNEYENFINHFERYKELNSTMMSLDETAMLGYGYLQAQNPQKAIEILLSYPDEQNSFWNTNIARSYAYLEKYKEALPYALKAYDIVCSEYKDNTLEATPEAIMVSFLYTELEEFQKDIEFIKSIPYEQSHALNNALAYSYARLNKYEEALPYSLKAIELANQECEFEDEKFYASGAVIIYSNLNEQQKADELREKYGLTEELWLYTQEEIDCIDYHIEKTIGVYEDVFHEMVSDALHIDICIVKPTPQRDFYTLVTMGMGARKMDIPDEFKEYELERAELMICLPKNWNISSDDERYYWATRWLKILARLPYTDDTWLCDGHTIPTGEPLAGTSFECILLEKPYTFKGADVCELPNGEKVKFYQLLPLYKEEMEYKLENGVEELIELFDDDFSDVVNVKRKNYCEPNKAITKFMQNFKKK
ncbi:suppressor of fused domain protein [Campylobacter geochelonis]|uniref:suppressor of fused domain protein n=1 Tax=Campylobacter geochelonis TaxID=1780362 RepID=UPI000770B5E3|nr:suppressor of fused domain protein [Campylobacter geochelonis]CZE49168.1 Suppressor of fused protein (SUFU) [Campylobacter geochelonis]